MKYENMKILLIDIKLIKMNLILKLKLLQLYYALLVIMNYIMKIYIIF